MTAYPMYDFNFILCSPYSEALSRARLLLKMSHSHARLEQIWGAGGGQQPMPQLVDQVCTVWLITKLGRLFYYLLDNPAAERILLFW